MHSTRKRYLTFSGAQYLQTPQCSVKGDVKSEHGGQIFVKGQILMVELEVEGGAPAPRSTPPFTRRGASFIAALLVSVCMLVLVVTWNQESVGVRIALRR